jgi:uncharacterized membrane protein YbaN (DUF454 family)
LKPVLFVLAWITFALGIIGAFLPIIPTTPFLILSAFLFSKCSPRFHAWLLNLPVAGEGIRDWQNNRVIRPRAKFLCASMIILSLVLIYLNVKIPLVVKIIVTIILVSVGTFVVTRKNQAD